jgi:hypothetical protein
MDIFKWQRQGVRVSNAEVIINMTVPPNLVFRFPAFKRTPFYRVFLYLYINNVFNFSYWIFRYFLFSFVPFPFYYFSIIFIFAYLNYFSLSVFCFLFPLCFDFTEVLYFTKLFCLLFPVLSSHVHVFVVACLITLPFVISLLGYFRLRHFREVCDMFVPAAGSLSIGGDCKWLR